MSDYAQDKIFVLVEYHAASNYIYLSFGRQCDHQKVFQRRQIE